METLEHQIEATYIIVALPLSAEDIKVLCSRALVVARVTQESRKDIAALFDAEIRSVAAQLVSAVDKGPDVSPEDFAKFVLDEIGIPSIDQLPEAEKGYVWAKSRSEWSSQRAYISRLEIFGAVLNEEIELKLQKLGFGRIEATDYGCIALRGSH